MVLSSLYFGASQLSDAVAAMIEGAAWLLFCISGVEIVRWRENARQRNLRLSRGSSDRGERSYSPIRSRRLAMAYSRFIFAMKLALISAGQTASHS